MKKLFAVVVIIAMTVALGLTAFAETVYTDTEGDIIWDAGFWLSNDSETPAEHSGRTIDAVINASGAISELGVPNYWASNPAVEGMANAVAHVNVYKFDVNYAKTKQGTPVASAEIELAGDSNVGTTTEVAGTNCKVTANGNAGIMLKFDTALPAGQYVVEFSQVAQAELMHYLVLPMTQKEYPNDTVAYYLDGEKDENLTLRLAVNLDGELHTLIPDREEPDTQPGTEPATQPGTEPATQPGTAPATQPETVPQTGDFSVAMFAVIAILAMGAAVVFMKKRSF
jgi:LPXTG-motif cell wall-anchored protein